MAPRGERKTRTQKPTPLYPVGEDEEWYIPARDGDGHSAWLKVQTHPGWQVELANIVAGKEFPAYQNPDDVIRHALYRHLKWLEGKGHGSSLVGEINAVLVVLRERDLLAKFAEIFDQVEVAWADHLTSGTVDMGKRLLEQVLEKIEAMPAGGWQDRYREEFYRKFGDRM